MGRPRGACIGKQQDAAYLLFPAAMNDCVFLAEELWVVQLCVQRSTEQYPQPQTYPQPTCL